MLFKSEIEDFKTEIETEVSNRYKTELEQNKALIKHLNNIISDKDKTINQLNHQITINIQSEYVEKQAETENIKQTNAEVDLVDENNGSLFTYDTSFSREAELKNMSEEKLKSIAKQYKITKRKKDLIIAEIIKHESKK